MTETLQEARIAPSNDIESLIGREYEQGFVTDIESETLPPGIDEGVVARVSEIKGEPTSCASGASRPFGAGGR